MYFHYTYYYYKGEEEEEEEEKEKEKKEVDSSEEDNEMDGSRKSLCPPESLPDPPADRIPPIPAQGRTILQLVPKQLTAIKGMTSCSYDPLCSDQ